MLRNAAVNVLHPAGRGETPDARWPRGTPPWRGHWLQHHRAGGECRQNQGPLCDTGVTGGGRSPLCPRARGTVLITSVGEGGNKGSFARITRTWRHHSGCTSLQLPSLPCAAGVWIRPVTAINPSSAPNRGFLLWPGRSASFKINPLLQSAFQHPVNRNKKARLVCN